MLFEFLDAAVPEVLFVKLDSLRELVNDNYCRKPIGFDICHLQPRESYDCLPLHLIDKDIEAQREVVTCPWSQSKFVGKSSVI